MRALIASAVGSLVLVTGCASTGEMMDSGAVAKAFAQRSPACKWTAGTQSGEDFYYTNDANAGDLDRNIGDLTMQGTWRIKGDQLCIDFGQERCYGVSQVEKNTYNLLGADGAVDLRMTC